MICWHSSKSLAICSMISLIVPRMLCSLGGWLISAKFLRSRPSRTWYSVAIDVCARMKSTPTSSIAWTESYTNRIAVIPWLRRPSTPKVVPMGSAMAWVQIGSCPQAIWTRYAWWKRTIAVYFQWSNIWYISLKAQPQKKHTTVKSKRWLASLAKLQPQSNTA